MAVTFPPNLIEPIRRQMEVTTVTIKLDATNIPQGNRWEMDGACWMAVWDSHERKGWRWRPQNMRAFEKGGPTGEMVDYFTVIHIRK